MRRSRGMAAMTGCGLALALLGGACTTEPPEQTPKAVTTVLTTPVVTATATPSSSAAPPVTVTVTPPPSAAKTSSVRKSPWRCEPGYPSCTKAHSEKYLAELEYQKCLRDPEKIWDTRTQKCRYKTSGEVQSEYFDGPTG